LQIPEFRAYLKEIILLNEKLKDYKRQLPSGIKLSSDKENVDDITTDSNVGDPQLGHESEMYQEEKEPNCKNMLTCHTSSKDHMVQTVCSGAVDELPVNTLLLVAKDDMDDTHIIRIQVMNLFC
jgi:hypothetical protein